MFTSVIAFLAFFPLLLVGVPVAFALGVAVVVGLLVNGYPPLTLIPNLMFSSVDSFVLTAVPMFTLTGTIMQRGGIAQRIFDFANALVGWATGGLGAVNVLASLIFGGISGSATADAAGLGPIEVKAMEERGYPTAYSAAITAASSSLSQLIPPSIIMVIYALVAGESAVKMLVAGIIPGMLVAFALGVVNYVYSRRRKWGHDADFSIRNVLREGRRAIWSILAPVMLLGGIVSGWFTPTEAGFVAALYTLLIGVLAYREIKLKDIPGILVETGKNTGVALLILATASVIAHVIAREGIPQIAVSWIQSVSINGYVVLLLVCLLLLIVGTFMEAIAAVIVLTPILLPFVQGLGVSPIHLGVVMVVGLAIGLVTPPVGMSLFVLSSLLHLPMEKLVSALVPFILAMIVVLVIVATVPWVSTFLPSLL